MKKHYILLKTHKVTGLQYLCKHVTANQNTCFTYLGSGVRWRRHLAKHGPHIETVILAICENETEAKQKGLEYSELYNVVESKNFANLVPECGQGGADVVKFRKTKSSWRGFKLIGDANNAKRPDVKKKISEALTGRVFSDEWKAKLSAASQGRTAWNKGKPATQSSYDNLHKANVKVVCPHCGKDGGLGAMKRWHFDNCKLNTSRKGKADGNVSA